MGGCNSKRKHPHTPQSYQQMITLSDQNMLTYQGPFLHSILLMADKIVTRLRGSVELSW